MSNKLVSDFPAVNLIVGFNSYCCCFFFYYLSFFCYGCCDGPFRGCAGDWVKLGVAKRHGAVLGDAICLNSSLPCVLVDVVRCKMGIGRSCIFFIESQFVMNKLITRDALGVYRVKILVAFFFTRDALRADRVYNTAVCLFLHGSYKSVH